MADSKEMENRIVELEMHLANQEATVQDLSEAIAGQWDVLDKLSQTVDHLKDRFLSLENAIETDQSEDIPPPHY